MFVTHIYGCRRQTGVRVAAKEIEVLYVAEKTGRNPAPLFLYTNRSSFDPQLSYNREAS